MCNFHQVTATTASVALYRGTSGSQREDLAVSGSIRREQSLPEDLRFSFILWVAMGASMADNSFPLYRGVMTRTPIPEPEGTVTTPVHRV